MLDTFITELVGILVLQPIKVSAHGLAFDYIYILLSSAQKLACLSHKIE